jgi:rod shape determining protein RodA
MQTVIAAIRTFWKGADLLLLLLCLIASVFGVIVISSATAYLGSTRYVVIQCIAIVLGVIFYILFSLLDIDVIAERRELLMIFNVLFLSTLFVFGIEGDTGNRSWLSFSWLPFNIQPAEICKITFILILAKTLSINRERISSIPSVGQLLIATGITVGVILWASSDAGVALVYVFLFVLMAFIGGVGIGWFLLGIGTIAAAAPFVWSMMRDDQQLRIKMIFDSSIDPNGTGVRYQTHLSQVYLSAGGLSGQGLHQGVQTQSGIMPAQHTDFIFSVIGNELGMVGCIFTLLILSAILIRCIYVGVKSGSYLNRLICIGIAGMLFFQILVNVGMCLGLFPVVGLTLPFISYGGSSIVTTFAAAGIVSGVHLRPSPDNETRYIHPPG